MRANDEIETEIEALEALDVGDRSSQLRKAEIDVLRERLSEDEVYDRYGEDSDPEGFDEEMFIGALAATMWLYGTKREAPSWGWQ